MPLTAPMNETQVNALSPLTLAAIGDSVFDLLVRVRLCAAGTPNARELHRERVERVNARAQARGAEAMIPFLEAEETAVYKRGRNAQPGSVPPAASRAEYQAATALETLFGWLYLLGRTQRLQELFEVIVRSSA